MCSNTGIEEAILSGDVKAAEDLTRQWLSSGRSAQEFQENVLPKAVDVIRGQFAQQAFYLPELLVALCAAQAALRVVHATGGRTRGCGKVVVGSLAWNGHGMCRDVVVSLLKVSGWDVVDLGGNVSPAQFVDACVETRASALVIAELPVASGRMASRVPYQEVATLLEEMEARGVRQRTRILLVGHNPLQEPHDVDAVCDDLMEVPRSVQRLVMDAYAESSSH